MFWPNPLPVPKHWSISPIPELEKSAKSPEQTILENKEENGSGHVAVGRTSRPQDTWVLAILGWEEKEMEMRCLIRRRGRGTHTRAKLAHRAVSLGTDLVVGAVKYFEKELIIRELCRAWSGMSCLFWPSNSITLGGPGRREEGEQRRRDGRQEARRRRGERALC